MLVDMQQEGDASYFSCAYSSRRMERRSKRKDDGEVFPRKFLLVAVLEIEACLIPVVPMVASA